MVSVLEGLPRFAAPRTRPLVKAIAARAKDLDWRQTYSQADFGELFLQSYGWSEWIGQRGAFVRDAIAGGVLLLSAPTQNIPPIRTTGEPLLAAYVRRAGELAAKSHIDK